MGFEQNGNWYKRPENKTELKGVVLDDRYPIESQDHDTLPQQIVTPGHYFKNGPAGDEAQKSKILEQNFSQPAFLTEKDQDMFDDTVALFLNMTEDDGGNVIIGTQSASAIRVYENKIVRMLKDAYDKLDKEKTFVLGMLDVFKTQKALSDVDLERRKEYSYRNDRLDDTVRYYKTEEKKLKGIYDTLLSGGKQ